jgi:chromosome segregation ATPase
MEKGNLEIVLERVESKFDLVVEAYGTLHKKIDDVQSSLEEKIDDNQRKNEEEHHLLQLMIKEVSQETKDIRKELAEFRQENEAAHKEIKAGIKLSYSELDTRIRSLEQGFSSVNQRLSRLEAARA